MNSPQEIRFENALHHADTRRAREIAEQMSEEGGSREVALHVATLLVDIEKALLDKKQPEQEELNLRDIEGALQKKVNQSITSILDAEQGINVNYLRVRGMRYHQALLLVQMVLEQNWSLESWAEKALLVGGFMGMIAPGQKPPKSAQDDLLAVSWEDYDFPADLEGEQDDKESSGEHRALVFHS